MPFGAVRAVAHAEARRRWRALVALGVVAGLVGAAVLGALALARRTSTAYDRLVAATQMEDARALVMDPAAASRLTASPGVTASWTAGLMIGKLQGPGVTYMGVMAGSRPPRGLYTPVVIAGRPFADDAPDEALLLETIAEQLHVQPGDTVQLKMLLPEEVAMFDVGFGEPDGPDVTLHITGIVRSPGDASTAPIIASPAFGARHASSVAASAVLLRLDGDPAAQAAFTAAVDDLRATLTPPAGAEELSPLDLTYSATQRGPVVATTRVLVGGIVVFAAVAAAAGVLALGQAYARHHVASAAAQRVEAALGLTGRERALARTLPALISVGVACAVGGVGATAFAGIGPPGAIARFEPSPGRHLNVAIVATGLVAVALMTLGLAAVTAARAGRPAGRARRPSRTWPSLLARLARRPSTAAGAALVAATPAGSPSRAGSLRSSLGAVVIGVAGVVAAATFGAGLDRLATEPSRYGWAADFDVVDANDSIVAELFADPQLDAVTVVSAATVRIEADDVPSYAFGTRKGSVGWTMLAGREPVASGEVALGARFADRSGLGLGDDVTAYDAAGSGRPLRVVGIGVGPVLSNDRFGIAALLSPDDLTALGHSAPFRDALVHVAPGSDRGEVEAGYSQRYEVSSRQVPPDVRNLLELGNLPDALGLFLACVAAVALAHTLVVTTRRQSRDLAVMRALGFTTRQVTRTVMVLALGACAAGLSVGVPLGLLTGRLVWWAVADSTGLATGPAYAWWSVSVLVPVALAGSALLAWLPARRAAGRAPAELLRSE